MSTVYPWSAVVGQERLKLALLLCAIDPALGGVLIAGPRGVAKTTLARALAELVPGRFVELPLGASEERVTGTLDLDVALRDGRVTFAPGLLARAHEGVLYVDEVNLLPDALVDLLLDAAASGQHTLERDGISHAHPARFVLIGTMNPEEGELRPQLTDRFGLSVEAEAQIAPAERAAILRHRLAYDADPAAFVDSFAHAQRALVERCLRARELAPSIPLSDELVAHVTTRCHAAGVEGVRADLAMLRAARAHAALHARSAITIADVDAVAEFALAHRRHDSEPPTSPPGGARGGSPAGSAQGPASSTSKSSASAHGEPAGALRSPDRPPSKRSASAHREPAGAPGSLGDRQSPAHDARSKYERGSDSELDRGALAPVPVPVAPFPRLASCAPLLAALPASQPRTAELRRRGRAVREAARGRLARRAQHGTIDWFATLARCARPQHGDLRYRARRAPERRLLILAIDCSASMLRNGALAVAKAVAMALSRRARALGAHVALISFRGAAACVRVTRDKRVLEHSIAALGAGGGTPLLPALERAHALARERPWHAPHVHKQLVLLTDGRTREPVAQLARRTDLGLLVLDCEQGPLQLGRARTLADTLHGRYLHVAALTPRAPGS